MLDLVLYFFRQQKLFLFFGLLFFASIYSYILSIYFLELLPFTINIFNLLLVFALLWLILFYISFSKNKNQYANDREKEKYNLLRHKTTMEYQLDIKDNIFSKVDLITSYMKDKFSNKSLLTIRVLKVINTSLSLYIQNLKIKNELNKALSLTSDTSKKEFYKSEIQKNTMQNSTIEKNLDNLIQELMSKNNNDTKINKIISEYEHSTEILSKIKH